MSKMLLLMSLALLICNVAGLIAISWWLVALPALLALLFPIVFFGWAIMVAGAIFVVAMIVAASDRK